MAINQYKDGKGVNDHKKGNRTDSKRNTAHIQELNKRFKEDIAGYKEFAEKRRKNRTVKQEDSGEYLNRLIRYIEECKEKEQPITRAEIILTLGVGKDTYYQMKSGELDFRLYEYIDINSIVLEDAAINDMGIPCVLDSNNREVLLIPFSEIIEKGELLLEAQTEARLYKSGRVGDIFALKAVHGWQEEQQTPHTVNQTLIIGESDARKAIEALEKARLP